MEINARERAVVSKMSARQRELVENGAKGVADRWLNDPAEAARQGAAHRSAVKKFGGKTAAGDTKPPDPERRARQRSNRAEQAVAGMMGPGSGSFDEKSIADWLGKMSEEDRRKLGRLIGIARQGKGEDDKDAGTKNWERVKDELARRGVYFEVRAGNVTINTGEQAAARAPYGKRPNSDWGRQIAKIKDFING